MLEEKEGLTDGSFPWHPAQSRRRQLCPAHLLTSNLLSHSIGNIKCALVLCKDIYDKVSDVTES